MLSTYTTQQGDTWDMICYKLYGNAYAMHHLIAANPLYRAYLVFSANVMLSIPEIEMTTVDTLPPWKRSSSL